LGIHAGIGFFSRELMGGGRCPVWQMPCLANYVSGFGVVLNSRNRVGVVLLLLVNVLISRPSEGLSLIHRRDIPCISEALEASVG